MLGDQFQGVFSQQTAAGAEPLFGVGNEQQLEDINKALSVGYAYPPTTGADALRAESLDSTLRVVTFSLNNIKLWPKIPQSQAYSTVESYSMLTAYGDESGIFTNAGELPQTQDSQYVRKTAQVKYCGIVGQVTHPTTLINTPFGDLVALETQNKAMRLVQGIESSLFNGRSDVVGQEFDGIYKQILDGTYGTNSAPVFDPWNSNPVQASRSCVIDLRGSSLTEDLLETGINQVIENYDEPTDLFMAPRASSDLNKAMYPRERINLPMPNASGRVGFGVTGYRDVTFNHDVFLRPGVLGRKAPTTLATNVNAPNAPTGVTVAAAADGTNQSMFGGGDAATYVYAVSAVNRYGESAAFTTSGQAVAAGQRVTLTITDGGGANPATGYRIYRTLNGAPASLGPVMMTTIPRTTIAGTGVFIDYNFHIPGTSRAYMIPLNDRFFTFKKLSPMVKIPLATVDISIRWAQVLYGTPIVYEPTRAVVFINVKDM